MNSAKNKTSLQTRSSQQVLLALVRESCETLLLSHPSVVGSLTVSQVLHDTGAARNAARMARRVAEEYGLDIEVAVNGNTVTARVSGDDGYIRLKRNRSRNGAH